jgi:predicted MPP superfamily phosphohydrolase
MVKAGSTESGKPKVSRRRFLKWGLLGGAGVVVGVGLDALSVEPGWIDVTHPVVPVRRLPEAWVGVRVALLADFHVGPLVELRHAKRAVELTLEEKPDLVVLAGDFVSSVGAITAEFAGVLARLRAPDGVFASLGNHDHWTDAVRVREMLAAAGVTLLENRHVILGRDGSTLALAGVEDLWEGQPSAGRALDGLDDDVPRILVSHNPDYVEEMDASAPVDLVLAGHTHGGQVKIPFGPRPILPVKHAKYGAGLVEGPHCPVYVTRGIGLIGPPVRFNCRPEVAILTLARTDHETEGNA